MVTKQQKRTRVLLIVALCMVCITGLIVGLSMPYILERDDPALQAHPEIPETEPETEYVEEAGAETEPTLPPPLPNPYGPLDFQYEGRFLKLIEGESVAGIDVSRWQYDIDWEAVADAGAEFAMIRVGYRGSETGKLNEDKYARQNLEGAAAAGLDVGVYFFSQALTREEAEEEAYFVLDFIQDYDITMPVVFDWEKVRNENSRSLEMDRRTLTNCAITFLETVEMAGYNAMVYFNPNQSRNLYHLAELKQFDFWLASYTDRMDFPYRVDMWQYTEKGRIPGIETECDFNIYFPPVG